MWPVTIFIPSVKDCTLQLNQSAPPQPRHCTNTTGVGKGFFPAGERDPQVKTPAATPNDQCSIPQKPGGGRRASCSSAVSRSPCAPRHSHPHLEEIVTTWVTFKSNSACFRFCRKLNSLKWLNTQKCQRLWQISEIQTVKSLKVYWNILMISFTNCLWLKKWYNYMRSLSCLPVTLCWSGRTGSLPHECLLVLI